MPTNASTTQLIETNIRFNRALETFRHFASKWNGLDREVLIMQITKGLKEAQRGRKDIASNYLMNALYTTFHNDRDDQFFWGNKGQQYLGEAIHDFVPVAILCQPNHLKQIYQFCQDLQPKEPILSLKFFKQKLSNKHHS